VHEGERLWQYAVLVTDVDYPIETVGQLYRDRADAENGFDALKNQWGLSGFTTQDINRCQSTARACALVYNWWSWYCRAANPQARMQAITSRPPLLAAVGRTVSHAGTNTLYLSPMHAGRDKRQYQSGFAPCSNDCAAVQKYRPLGGLATLHLQSHRPCYQTKKPPNPERRGGVTAVSRVKASHNAMSLFIQFSVTPAMHLEQAIILKLEHRDDMCASTLREVHQGA